MAISGSIQTLAAGALLASFSLSASAQSVSAAKPALSEPAVSPLALPEDRGAAALEQSLRRLRTTASVLEIVAHPDDEDGALLTYLSRVLGARVTLLTLTRGEGGQNAMGGESYDALGLIRTNELLRADEYYGVRQLWGTEADFGFSKTQQESFARWGHERVLYDAVLAVRRVRPQIILSTFVGGISDGHGHHQVAGEIAQEALRAAADSTVFPDQIQAGFLPWQAQAVYSMTPFARIDGEKMFDYATGSWAPAEFKNYLTGAWTKGALATDVTVPVGVRDAVLGRSPLQIAREGWGEQRSQYGGANPALSGPASSGYHLWFVTPSAQAPADSSAAGNDLFRNSRVRIDTSLAGLASLAGANPPAWLGTGLTGIDDSLQRFAKDRSTPESQAHQLAAVYKKLLGLREQVAASSLPAEAHSNLLFELDAKADQFQAALKELLGLDMEAFRASVANGPQGGPAGRGGSAEESPRAVVPGESFRVRVHTAQDGEQAQLSRIWLQSRSGSPWKAEQDAQQSNGSEQYFNVLAAEDAQPTQPYFTRPTIEQPFYDLANPALRGDSLAPWPLEAWAEYTFDGVPIRLGQVVQTLARVPGRGGVYEPLIVTPAVGVSMEPEAMLLPEDGKPLEVRVRVQAQKAAAGSVTLQLPSGWRSEPTQIAFDLKKSGESEPLLFRVRPASGEWSTVKDGAYTVAAAAQVDGHSYNTGWRTIGYAGLRPYNLYRAAAMRTRKVDAQVAAGRSVAYVMGTGDEMPAAMESLGVKPHLLSDAELKSADLSQWNTILVGIRAYTARPVLTAVESRLEEYVRHGGSLVVLYQGNDFPAPAPLKLAHPPINVVEEQAAVKVIEPGNALLNTPNKITAADFEDWVEERGHSFLESWDPAYTALTETADQGQAAQRGGLVVAHFGQGTYVYVAYALHRQVPELVPGAWRILANLLSVGARAQTN